MKQLFDAIQAGDAAAVRSLLDGAPELVNATDDRGIPAFTAAKYNRKDEIAQLLLDRGAKLDIFAASMTGDNGRVRELLGANAEVVRSLSHDGWTALHLASFFGHAECANSLIEAGADVTARSTNPMQNMPLHAAAAGRKIDVVRLLLEKGAPVNAQQHGGWTALHAAAQNGDTEMAEVLIGAGANVTVRADNQQGAWDLAVLKGHQAMVDILENFGAGK
jgi:ankyrin repeat protein